MKASIWKNSSDKGPFYTLQFSRTFQDKDGSYQDSFAFPENDLLRLGYLILKAEDRKNELRAADRKSGARHHDLPEKVDRNVLAKESNR